MKNKSLIPYNLQFFAEGGEGGSEGAGEGTGAQGGADGGQQGNGDQNLGGQDDDKSGEKKFTQSELSAVAATEKKQGKQSILNIFGVKNEKEAKEQAEAFKKWQESQKDAETKMKDAQTAASEAEQRAIAAEAKLACVTAGVQKDCIDDALAIASTKVTEDKDLNTVLEEMKKEPRYKGFFAASGSGSGTGSSADHKIGAGTGGTENIGARLGKAKKTEAKSSFFTN